MAQEPDALLMRAEAAIAAAKLLVDRMNDSSASAHKLIRRISLRARFYPRTLKFYSASDFPETRPPYQPFLIQADDL